MPLDEKSPGLRLCDAAMRAPPSSSSHHAVLQWMKQSALISVEDFDHIITSDNVDGFSKEVLVRVDDPVIEKFPEDLESLEPGTIIAFFGCSNKGSFKNMFKFKETPTLQHSMIVLPNKLVAGVGNEGYTTDQSAMKVGDLHAVLQWSQLKPTTQTVRYQSLETIRRRIRSSS